MKRITRFIAYLLVFCLTVTCIPPIGAYAAESETDVTAVTETSAENETESAAAAETEAEDDGLPLRQYSDFAGDSSKARSLAVDSSALTHAEKFLYKYDVENGIDISHHNGTVNWNKVKADGVDFAIIRMAYRGYGSAGTIKPDNNAIKNLEGALAAGLDVGVYFFSQAVTTKEAIQEANYILDLVEGYEFDLPIVMDYEYTAKADDGRLWVARQNGMTDSQRTQACLAFCETVENAGYDAMVYADKNMLETDLYADKIDAEYEIWLAHWTTKTSYANDYTYWQYSDNGSVNGVPSERVDLNVRYVYAPFKIMNFSDSSVTMQWDPVEGAEGYIVYRKTAGGADEIIAETDDPAVLSYTDTSVQSNTKYHYYVDYYKTDENGEKQISETGYPEKTVRTALKKVSLNGAAANAGTVKLSWSKEENGSGYVVQRYNSSTKKYETVKTITSPNTLSYNDTGLKIGTSYKYRVRAYSTATGVKMYGTYSAPVTVKTASSLTVPSVTAKGSSYTTVKLSWKKVPGAVGYIVQRYDKSKGKYVTIKTIKSANTLTYSNTYLNSATTYKYRIRAYAALSGKTVYSKYSAVMSAKTGKSRAAVVKNGPLNVRKGAGTKYGKLTTVKKGAKLTVTGSTKSWYKIKIKVKGKYKTGYVLKKYVKLK